MKSKYDLSGNNLRQQILAGKSSGWGSPKCVMHMRHTNNVKLSSYLWISRVGLGEKSDTFMTFTRNKEAGVLKTVFVLLLYAHTFVRKIELRL